VNSGLAWPRLLAISWFAWTIFAPHARLAAPVTEHRPPAETQSQPAKLIVFNAGGLTAPFGDLLHEFARIHPGVDPEQESSGSLDAVRKITELQKPCDVLAVADYEVISSLLVPQYADWYVLFARNQMVLMYTQRSKFAAEINGSNWFQILLRLGVESAHSDPDADPAGYRTLLVWKLAEKYYGRPNLFKDLNAAVPAKNIRPKSVELVALLQAGEFDYVYGYRSVAEQNKLPFVTLPPEIDLGDINKADSYATVSVDVAGKKPGDRVKIQGVPILFALTIPKGAPHESLAEDFLRFMFSPEGQQTLKRNHLLLISPPLASGIEKMPASLRGQFVPLGKGGEPKP